MTRKIFVLIMFLLFPIVGQASATDFEGSNIILGLGYTTIKGTASGGNVSSSGSIIGSYTATADNLNTPIAIIDAEYMKALSQNWLLGLGAGISPGHSKTAKETINYNLLGNQGRASEYYWFENAYSIYLKPAYVIDKNSLVYSKLGYSRSHGNADDHYGILFSGWALGLGYSINFKPNWFGFSEIKYTSFASENVNPHFFPSLNNDGTAKVNASEVVFGIGYHM